jgi:OOP family OmpA-OmpF porin
VPPNWYYLPPAAYDDYGFYDPSEVVVLPGRARPDLITEVSVTEMYTPPSPPPAILVEAPPPPPRPVPLSPPPIPAQMTQVQNVVEVLSRPREANAPRYDGPVLVTSSVHFEYDSYAIQPDSFPTLDAIGTALTEEMPDAIINIEGHTDADGSDEYNQNLSEQRAWSVKSYLVQRFGIDPNRLITVGYGERAPIADNNSDAGKAMNRRAEFENVTDLYSAQVVDIETASPAPGTVEY